MTSASTAARKKEILNTIFPKKNELDYPDYANLDKLTSFIDVGKEKIPD